MKILISHVTEEAPIAKVLKEWIESTFLGKCSVFVSSDTESLPAGVRWLEKVDEALGSSDVLIVICSPYSLSRPWVNFEMGCGWSRKIPIIPICHSGQTKSKLPSPISSFQALDINDPTFVESLINSLGNHLGFQKMPKLDVTAMRHELLSAIDSVSNDRPKSEDLTIQTGSHTEIEEGALRALGEIANMSNRGLPCTPFNLAARLTITEEKARYYLDVLHEGGFLEGHFSYMDEDHYTLSSKGRKVLVDSGLL